MNLDFASLVLTEALFGILYSGVAITMSRSYPSNIRGLKLQAAAVFVFSFCMVITAIRGPLAPLWMHWVPAALVCVAAALASACVCQLTERRVPLRTLSILVGLNALVAAAVLLFAPAKNLASSVAALNGAALLLIGARAAVRWPLRDNSVARWAVFLSLGSVATLTLLKPLVDAIGSVPASVSGLLLLLNAVAFGGFCFGAILMANERLRRELTQIAVTDMLTGVYSRRAFFEQAHAREVAANTATAARRKIDRDSTSRRFGILMVDVDFFKKINDNFGHQVGDNVLRELGRVINHTLGANDVAGRYGGEEFALLIEDGSVESMTLICRRLNLALSQRPASPSGNQHIPPFTLSIGAAIAQPGESVEECISRADAALYQAKRGGRNRVEWAASPKPSADADNSGLPFAAAPAGT